jgi:hypothetical protein
MGNANNTAESSHVQKPLGKINQKDLDLIRSSWSLIESKEAFGIEIMVQLLSNYKQIKDKWIFAANLETEEEMRENSQLKYHAKNIVKVFGSVVEKVINAPSPESINIDECGLVTLGTKHFHFDVSRPNFEVLNFFLNSLKIFFHFNFLVIEHLIT